MQKNVFSVVSCDFMNKSYVDIEQLTIMRLGKTKTAANVNGLLRYNCITMLLIID